MKRIGFYTALILCLLLSQAVYGQVNVKDSLQVILQSDTITSENRFIHAYNLVFHNSSPEEAEALALNVMYPFVKETWEDESEQLAHLSRLYLLISFCHRERGGDDRDEKEQQFAEKALEVARESGDNAVCARCCMASGFREIKRGDVKQAHKYLYEAIGYYDKMGMYVKSSEMLYVIVSNFFEIKDTDGMQRILGQMEEYLKKDMSKQSLYQYNVIKKSYFVLLLEKEKAKTETVDYRLVDSLMVYINRNIALVENHLDELDPHWMHGYAYYYLAKELDTYYPEQTESIFLHLDKALEMMDKESVSRTNEANSVMELKIHVNEVRAQALFRIGKMQESYQAMSEALLLLDQLRNYKNLNVSRHAAYQFMVDYYEKINQPAEALRYQKLLQESEAERYENEKVQAINDMSAKYETEKKEMRIQTLIQEKKTAQRILWLTGGLLLALLATFLLVILSSRLKRRNMEQRFYEIALLAELRQNELEKMQSVKQHLEQHPVENMMDNMAQLVSASLIDKDDKRTYLERISKIDAKLLGQAYQTSNVKITSMDMKYIICFSAGIDVKDISLLFNVDPASVRTVRYRIKKKFAKEDAFRMIL